MKTKKELNQSLHLELTRMLGGHADLYACHAEAGASRQESVGRVASKAESDEL
jgi:hypothetical protein